MRLVIDPGTEKSAFLFMGLDGSIRDFNNHIDNGQLLLICGTREYHELIIEEICSYGMPVGKETFETIKWSARFGLRAADRFLPVHEVPRLRVKVHLCGTAKAKDANIRQRLLDIHGKESTKGIATHGWAALALATYWHETHPVKTFKPTCHADEDPNAYLVG